MNRKERRAQRHEIPPGYVEATKRLVRIAQAFVQSGVETPRFAMPPRDLLLIAGLDQVGSRFAQNETALALIQLACDVELRDMPTPAMLRVALDAAGIPCETRALEELGLELDKFTVLSCGGNA